MSEPGLFCQVNRVKDPNKKEPLEQKHLPVIEVPDELKSEQFFNAETIIPLSIAHGSRKTILRAVSRCNLHGIWESTKEIEIQ